MRIDTVIFGGGAAGLWVLDELVRAGRSVLLLEAGELGAGQTIASQGIIHGGLKYTLQGLLTRSAANIREMPLLWRNCLAGKQQPTLRQTRIRSDHCYLWRTESVSSRLGMIGARFGLRIAAESLAEESRPTLLAGCPGTVASMAEQVISPASFLAELSVRHGDRILKIDLEQGLSIETSQPGQIERIDLIDSRSRQQLSLEPGHVVFTAGAGNAALRTRARLSSPLMQRRPLHMVLVRGDLPQLNGHCVDGAKTRVTITSDVDASGRTVWQLGGQIAELGVALNSEPLIVQARAELETVIPGIDLSAVEWATYRVDRAEGRTAGGGRPEAVQIYHDGNTMTAWPTKLALVPELAQQIAATILKIPSVVAEHPAIPTDWRRPQVAAPPWETVETWHRLEESSQQQRDQAA